jgi:RNA polymerase sigma-70 factor (ECF subfamily)
VTPAAAPPPPPPPADDPAELAHRILAGDAAAEEELVRRFSRGVLYHLRKLTGDPVLSEDFHQDTFRIVLERLRRAPLDNPSQLAGFILGTARNVARGEQRKRRRRGDEPLPEGSDDRFAAPAAGQLERVLRDEEDRSVERLLAELSTERDRQLLLRFYVGEEERESICADLSLTAGQFNRVVFRARRRFKELLLAAGLGRRGAIGEPSETDS